MKKKRKLNLSDIENIGSNTVVGGAVIGSIGFASGSLPVTVVGVTTTLSGVITVGSTHFTELIRTRRKRKK